MAEGTGVVEGADGGWSRVCRVEGSGCRWLWRGLQGGLRCLNSRVVIGEVKTTTQANLYSS